MSKNRKNAAFTLAEVLITLAIIGVVASMTIPSLKANLDKQQNQALFKKTYSEISQATKRVIQEQGGTLLGRYATSGPVWDDLGKYVEYTKRCSNGTSPGNCWHVDNEYNYNNGNPVSTPSNNEGVFLKNGVMMYVWNRTANCTLNAPNNACAEIAIDVNGFKKPNKVGNDIYMMYLLKDRTLPAGINNDPRASKTFGWVYSSYVLLGRDY